MNRPIDIGTDRREKTKQAGTPDAPRLTPRPTVSKNGEMMIKATIDEMRRTETSRKQAENAGWHSTTGRRDENIALTHGDGKQAAEATSNMRLNRETTERDDNPPRPTRRRTGRRQARRQLMR